VVQPTLPPQGRETKRAEPTQLDPLILFVEKKDIDAAHSYQAHSGTVGSSFRTKCGRRLRAACLARLGLPFLVAGTDVDSGLLDAWEGGDGPTGRRACAWRLSAGPS